jgi:hypothetical protein
VRPPTKGVLVATIGERFAQALAAKDRAALRDVLDPAIDFKALTPRKFWEASSADALVDEVILGAWFEPKDHIDSLDEVRTSSVADRDHVSYRLHLTNPDGSFLVEQQAYFSVEGERIVYLRILCSGYRPLDEQTSGS